ncbi:MAG: hypothetical protein ABI672_10825 [Vicinamibacteria bacterium]
MKRIALIALTAATLGFGTTAPADAAQVRLGIHIGNDRPSYRYSGTRIGFDNGYRDGLREGKRDDYRNEGFNFRDERSYRAGDVGYRFEYGPRYEYVSSYRRGFEEGYRRGNDDRRDNRRSYRR